MFDIPKYSRPVTFNSIEKSVIWQCISYGQNTNPK